jgi:predicted Zn-ribbon and HTH transcriptional regulator
VTAEEITRLLLCEHKEPLQITHNKIIALILENLSIEGLITPKWQMVAGDKKCFTSKMGKLLTAKDLSSAKQMAEFINDKKHKMILDSIEAVKKAK